MNGFFSPNGDRALYINGIFPSNGSEVPNMNGIFPSNGPRVQYKWIFSLLFSSNGPGFP